MMENFPQQSCLWVNNHVSTFQGTNEMLQSLRDAIDALCPFSMTLVLQEDTGHQQNCFYIERQALFDEDVLQFFKKLANPETHTNLRRSLLTFLIQKGQVQFQDDEMLPENSMGAAISQDEIGQDNMVELRVERAWRDIKEHHVTKNNIIGQRSIWMREWQQGCWKWFTHSGSIVASLYITRKGMDHV